MMQGMTRISRRTSAAWLACTLPALALAWAMPARADERSEIAAARVAAESTYAERVKSCDARFVVTSCVDDAKRDRRRTLDGLRTRQLALDERRRHERAEARRKEIADKVEDDARRGREPAASAAPTPAIDRPKPRPAPTPPPPRGPRSPAEPAAQRAAREAASRKAYADKQHEVGMHREQSLDATLRRLSAKPPASSLPVPPPASGASAAQAASR